MNKEIKNRTCEDCGYCNAYYTFSYCDCFDKGCHKIEDYNEAINCIYYDDDSWFD